MQICVEPFRWILPGTHSFLLVIELMFTNRKEAEQRPASFLVIPFGGTVLAGVVRPYPRDGRASLDQAAGLVELGLQVGPQSLQGFDVLHVVVPVRGLDRVGGQGATGDGQFAVHPLQVVAQGVDPVRQSGVHHLSRIAGQVVGQVRVAPELFGECQDGVHLDVVRGGLVKTSDLVVDGQPENLAEMLSAHADRHEDEADGNDAEQSEGGDLEHVHG